MDTDRLDALQKLPALKGPALSIMMALMIAQRPLLARQLQSYTGYKSDAVTQGLNILKDFQAIVHVGHYRGYMLTPLWRQLMLPLPEYPEKPDHPEKPDLPINGGSGGGGRSTGNDQSTTTSHKNPEKPDLPVDNSAFEGEITPRPASEITARGTTPEITARSGSDEITSVARWLSVAGIEPDSYHWQKIMDAGLMPEYVKSHVLEYLVDDKMGTGALIYRLEHGWKAPPMRCEECLHPEDDCRCHGGIPPEYRDLVQH